jgi:phage-related protein
LCTNYGTLLNMINSMRLLVKFYKSQSGNEPVREWLKDTKQIYDKDKETIGIDIKTVQFGWPMGMPLVRKLAADLWEVRSKISDGRLSRVIFTVEDDLMILLHGFIKKEQKTRREDIDIALKRLIQIRGEK